MLESFRNNTAVDIHSLNKFSLTTKIWINYKMSLKNAVNITEIKLIFVQSRQFLMFLRAIN